MARIISDLLYAKLVKNLMEQEPVQVFNELLHSEKTDDKKNDAHESGAGQDDGSGHGGNV